MSITKQKNLLCQILINNKDRTIYSSLKTLKQNQRDIFEGYTWPDLTTYVYGLHGDWVSDNLESSSGKSARQSYNTEKVDEKVASGSSSKEKDSSTIDFKEFTGNLSKKQLKSFATELSEKTGNKLMSAHQIKESQSQAVKEYKNNFTSSNAGKSTGKGGGKGGKNSRTPQTGRFTKYCELCDVKLGFKQHDHTTEEHKARLSGKSSYGGDWQVFR